MSLGSDLLSHPRQKIARTRGRVSLRAIAFFKGLVLSTAWLEHSTSGRPSLSKRCCFLPGMSLQLGAPLQQLQILLGSFLFVPLLLFVRRQSKHRRRVQKLRKNELVMARLIQGKGRGPIQGQAGRHRAQCQDRGVARRETVLEHNPIVHGMQPSDDR